MAPLFFRRVMKIVQPIAVADSGTFSRASTATYFNSSLVLSTAAVDERRITFNNDGSSYELIEESSTNYIRNNTMVGAAAGTPGTLPTNWASNIAGGITRQIVGTGTSSGIDYIDIRVFGTGVGTCTFRAEAFVLAPATIGQTWTYSQYVSVVGGSSANISNYSVGISEHDGGGIQVGVGSTVIIPTSSLSRLSHTMLLSQPTTASVASFIIFSVSGAIDVTLRIGLPQLEQKASATSLIKTTTVAVTRAADITNSMLQSNVPETDYSAYSATTGYTIGANVRSVGTNIHKTYQALKGGVFVVTMTIASPCVVTFPTGSNITEGLPIVFTTTGALPTGIVAGTTYYVKDLTGNTFNIAATLGGDAINTSGSQSGVHSVNTNYNVPVTNTAYWLDTGATNRWKMFDGSVQSQTTNPTSIYTVITTSSFVDTVAFLNTSASSIRVVMTTTDGVVYDQTKTLSSNLGITDWYSYFYTTIFRQTDVIFEGLPLYASASIAITITNSGTAACGACILGKATDISYTKKGVEHGARLGIHDYSIKTRDSFGNYTITERAFNRRADYTVFIEGGQVDGIMNLLSSIRAKPTLYIGSGKYSSTAVYGFYKDFTVEIAYPDKSVCTIQLEGLT